MLDFGRGLRRVHRHSTNWIAFHKPSNLVSPASLAQVRINQPQQLVIHSINFFFFGRPQSLARAVVQVVFHQVPGHAAQRFLCRGDLPDDVGAVAIFLDHLLKAADLPLNPAQPLPVAFLQDRVDGQCFVPGPHLAGAVGA